MIKNKNAVLCAAALAMISSFGGAHIAMAAPADAKNIVTSFKKITDSPRKALDVDPANFTPEQKAAFAEFDKKLNAARDMYMKENKFKEADEALQSLWNDKNIPEYYKVKALQSLADSANRQKNSEAHRAAFKMLLEAKDTFSRDRANAALMLMSSYRRDKMPSEGAKAGLLRLAEPGLTEAEIYNTKRDILGCLAEADEFDSFIPLAKEFVKEKEMKTLDRLSAYNLIVDTLMRFKRNEEALEFNTMLLESGDFQADQKASYELKSARCLQALGKNAEADKLRYSIVENTALTPQTRVNAFADYFTRLSGDRTSDKKALMASAAPIFAIQNLSADPFARTSLLLMNCAKDQLKDMAMAAQVAKSILAYPDVPNTEKFKALNYLTDYLLSQKQAADAEKAVSDALNWPELTLNTYIDITRKMAYIYRCLGKCDEAVALLFGILNKDQSPNTIKNVNKYVSDEYCYFKRFDEAAKLWRDAGETMEEAAVWRTAQDYPKAKAIARAVLENENAPVGERKAAFLYFLGNNKEDNEIRAKYLDFYLAQPNPYYNDFYLKGRSAMMNGDYPYALKMLEIGRMQPSIRDSFLSVLYMMNAYGALERYDDAAKIAKEYSTFKPFTSVEKQRLLLGAFLFENAKNKNFAKSFIAYEKKTAEDLAISTKDRIDNLIKTGRTALTGSLFDAAKDIQDIVDSYYVPEPKKKYTVPFYKENIDSINDFVALKKKPAPQYMDRKFGGNMDFLVTDVSTGDRGAGIGQEKGKQTKPTEFYALADSNGLHLFFRAYDDRAREVEAKLLGAGAYEMYLAPGINQPYSCFLPDLQKAENSIWNTTYNTEFHRRIRPDSKDVKYEQKFYDDGFLSHLFLDWSVFYDKLPDNGDIWEFENIHWGRAGGFSWNGTKSIHGRSTWGHLVFDIGKDDLINTKKKIIYGALAYYNTQKRTGHGSEGIIDFWQDDAIGDKAFYDAEIAPLVEKLDSYIPLVKTDMSKDDVEKVFVEAVPGWLEITLKIADLRKNYLKKQLTE